MQFGIVDSGIMDQILAQFVGIKLPKISYELMQNQQYFCDIPTNILHLSISSIPCSILYFWYFMLLCRWSMNWRADDPSIFSCTTTSTAHDPTSQIYLYMITSHMDRGIVGSSTSLYMINWYWRLHRRIINSIQKYPDIGIEYEQNGIGCGPGICLGSWVLFCNFMPTNEGKIMPINQWSTSQNCIL